MKLTITTKLLAALFTLSAFLCTGCKDDEELQPNYGSNTGTLVYEIVGVNDIALERVGEKKMQINVEHRSGNKATEVRLGASDLPEGMEVLFDVKEGNPSYISYLTFKNTRVKEGTYVINITGIANGTQLKRYPMTVKVLPYTNESDGLKGEYTETRHCSASDSDIHNVAVEADRNELNKITFKGLWSGVYDNELRATVDPATHSFQIPEQEVFQATFKGTGTYTDDEIKVSYTVTNSLFNESCTAVLIRNK